MRDKFQITMGAVIILFGLILLISNLTGIRLLSFMWPLILIGIGVWMILRPQRFSRQDNVQYRFFGGMNTKGNWVLENANIVSFIGDINMDLTKAVISPGETHIELRGFVGNIEITAAATIGIAVNSNAFVTSADVLGNKRDYFLMPYSFTSEQFSESESRVTFDLGFFVSDLKLTQIDA